MKKSDPCNMKWYYIILIGQLVFAMAGGVFWTIAAHNEDNDTFYTYFTLSIICLSLLTIFFIALLVYYMITQSYPKCRKLRAKLNKGVRYIYIR